MGLSLAGALVIYRVMVLLLTAVLTTDGCAQVIEQPIGNASALFGLRGDGVHLGAGQSFRMQEGGTIWFAVFKFENTGQSDSSVPAGTKDDLIECTLRHRDSMSPIGTAITYGFDNPLPGTRREQSLCFPLSLFVPKGDYVLTCENKAPTHYGFIGNIRDDSYPEGTRYTGYDGTWIPSPWDSEFLIRYFTRSSPVQEGPAITLQVAPAAGTVPLLVALTIPVGSGSLGSTYSIWWDCDSSLTDIGIVQESCGPPIRATSAREEYVITHIYGTPGRYMAKLILQSGCNSPSEARIPITVFAERRRPVRSQ